MSEPGPPTRWNIGLSFWIIQDGNYPDFEIGQTVEFAVEFWCPEGVAPLVSKGLTSATNVGGHVYNTVAEVVVRNTKITVLDIGILVYSQFAPLPASLPDGSRLEVQLALGVDPFSCGETLNKDGDVLPLVYSWKILSILRQTAPFVERVQAGSKVRTRDPQKLGYEEILKTDAWRDDDGFAEYMLRCDLLPIPPKRTSATAL
ncbi:MAG TPA: hypothetical protein VMH80_19640 [Bryobacteraceae bacterium]|nr:hypothetical protein [Bryobacteraceae bacterium]